MSFTGSNVVTVVRTLINDFDSTTWPDAVCLPHINEAVLDIYTNHGEARVKDDGTLRTYADLAAIGNVVDLADQYKPAVAQYLCWVYFSADAGDTRDAERAAEHRQTYESYFSANRAK